MLSVFVSSLSNAYSDSFGIVELYDEARKSDAEITAAISDYEESLLGLPIARSAFKPQASIDYQFSYNDVNADASDNFLEYGPTLTLEQSLYNKSNLESTDRAELVTIRASLELERQFQRLIDRVSNAYIDVLIADSELTFRLLEQQAIFRQKDLIENQYRLGQATETDYRDALAQYDLSVARKIDSTDSLARAHEGLNLITSRPMIKLRKFKMDSALLRPAPEGMNYWQNETRNNNLDYRLSQLDIDIAESAKRITKSSAYPTIDLVGIAGHIRSEQSNTLDTEYGQLMIELNLPLLTGGKYRADVSKAVARTDGARQRAILAGQIAEMNTNNNLRTLLAELSKIEALGNALESTTFSLQAQETGFREGLFPSVDVLRTLREKFQIESDYATARHEYIKHVIALKKSVGKLSRKDLVEIENTYLE